MKKLFLLGSIFGFLGVSLGAFGAHALKDLLGERITTYETASRYHFYHTIAIFISGFLFFIYSKREFLTSGYLFGIGILFFSGSLYLLSITGIRLFGAITPLGGVILLLAWLNLGITMIRIKDKVN